MFLFFLKITFNKPFKYRFEKSIKSLYLEQYKLELDYWSRLNKNIWLYCDSVKSELAFTADKYLLPVNETSKAEEWNILTHNVKAIIRLYKPGKNGNIYHLHLDSCLLATLQGANPLGNEELVLATWAASGNSFCNEILTSISLQ